MEVSVPTSKRHLYANGMLACNSGRKKEAPEHLNMEDKHWWLAGYGDREIEMAQQAKQSEDRMLRMRQAQTRVTLRRSKETRRRANDLAEQQYVQSHTREVWQ